MPLLLTDNQATHGLVLSEYLLHLDHASKILMVQRHHLKNNIEMLLKKVDPFKKFHNFYPLIFMIILSTKKNSSRTEKYLKFSTVNVNCLYNNERT